MPTIASSAAVSPIASAPRPAPGWQALIQEAVAALDYGAIQIKVHGGEVVQIETTRKIRVAAAPPEGRDFHEPHGRR